MFKAKVFTTFLLSIGCVLFLYLLPTTDFSLGWKGYLGLLLFLSINVISESQPLVLPGAQARITTSGLSSYAALAIFSPLLAAFSGAAAILLVGALIERKPLLKWLFNTAQLFITIALAGLSYQLLMASSINSLVPHNIIALAGAICIYFLTNTFIVSFLLSLVNDTSFWRIWSKNFQWEIIYVAGNVPLALLLILAYHRLWIAGPLLFLAPVLLLKESYAQYIRLKTTYTETVRTLIKVIEMHDTYTAGHSLRVAEYAKRLATARKLSVKESEKVEIAAYLHDLGKVDLAITHLVRKPGKLTADEKRRVQLHPLVSADIAAQVTYFRGDIERIIRHHHENYNGTGYPHGLKDSEIPIGSRIILIADAFDAMTSNRMYRSALDFEKVRNEFIKYAGIQFDPDLVDLFLNHCVKDESMIIQQLEIPYEDLLSTKLAPVTIEPVSSVG